MWEQRSHFYFNYVLFLVTINKGFPSPPHLRIKLFVCFCELLFVSFIHFPVEVLVFFLLTYEDSVYSEIISPFVGIDTFLRVW